MSSIMTNASALQALQSLNSTNKSMETTQSRIATGYRVSTASDNAAYWSIATTMRSDNKALSAVQDSLGLGAGKIDTAYTGMNKAIEVVDQIKAKLIAARGASEADQTKIQAEITQLQGNLTSIGVGANYAGSNMLATDDTATIAVVASYNRAADGTTSISTIDIDVSTIALMAADGSDGGLLDDIMAIDVTAADATTIDGFLTDLETGFAAMATAAADLGAAKTRIDLQKDFVSSLMDSVDRGVGQLVDADMNKESTRLQALQVQQQLGIQALSIANQNAQSILSLFR
jgi:flagellin